MSHCRKYLKSFGKLTKEQEEMVKKTTIYQACKLRDALDDFGIEILKLLPKKIKERFIPKGFYCYEWKDGERKWCPFLEHRKDKPEQECGYCHYLGKGDWDINTSDRVFVNCKTGEKILAKDMPIPVGLLWDCCKECGVNDEWEDEDEA